MVRARALLVVLLFALAAAGAQAQSASGLAGGWESCEALKQDCLNSPAEDIWHAAYFSGPGSTIIGTCYVHDEGTCPNCACYDYVKVSYLEQPKGWDGGTGCMGLKQNISPAQSHAAAAAKIKELCEKGACCCPEVEAEPCADPRPVRARDPLTGSCCNFPNACSAPTDWIVPAASWECP